MSELELPSSDCWASECVHLSVDEIASGDTERWTSKSGHGILGWSFEADIVSGLSEEETSVDDCPKEDEQ